MKTTFAMLALLPLVAFPAAAQTPKNPNRDGATTSDLQDKPDPTGVPLQK